MLLFLHGYFWQYVIIYVYLSQWNFLLVTKCIHKIYIKCEFITNKIKYFDNTLLIQLVIII